MLIIELTSLPYKYDNKCASSQHERADDIIGRSHRGNKGGAAHVQQAPPSYDYANEKCLRVTPAPATSQGKDSRQQWQAVAVANQSHIKVAAITARRCIRDQTRKSSVRGL